MLCPINQEIKKLVNNYSEYVRLILLLNKKFVKSPPPGADTRGRTRA